MKTAALSPSPVTLFGDLVKIAQESSGERSLSLLGFEDSEKSQKRIRGEVLGKDPSAWTKITEMVSSLPSNVVDSLSGLLANFTSIVDDKKHEQVKSSVKETLIKLLPQADITPRTFSTQNLYRVKNCPNAFRNGEDSLPQDSTTEVPLHFLIKISDKTFNVDITFASNDGTWSRDSIEMRRLVLNGDGSRYLVFNLSDSCDQSQIENHGEPDLVLKESLIQSGFLQKALDQIIMPAVERDGGPFTKAAS